MMPGMRIGAIASTLAVLFLGCVSSALGSPAYEHALLHVSNDRGATWDSRGSYRTYWAMRVTIDGKPPIEERISSCLVYYYSRGVSVRLSTCDRTRGRSRMHVRATSPRANGSSIEVRISASA